MYHSRLILFVLVSAHIAVFPVICTSHYSIVAPGTIRSNRNYSVCVTLHDAAQAATLRLSVRSLTSSMHLSQDVTVQPFEIRLISFMPPKLYDKFQYELKVEGIQGIILSESKPLYAMEEGGPRIYIESDRAFYKPSDIVQFRVVILNEHLRLTNIVEPIRIQILDSQENRVKQYKDIRLDRGVFAGKFQLSQQPLLGNWTISVFISGKYNMKKDITFKVEKYVLPKFSVHIENPRNVVEQDLFIPVTIYGKYTFGRYVEGFVDVYLEDEIGYTAGNVSAYIGSGEAKVDLLLNFSGLKSPLIIYIRAKLRERHSNVTAEANSVLFVHRQRYYMDYEIEYRNGNPYRFNVHVQHLNGTKVRDVQTPVKMLVADREYSSRLNENGVAQFEVDVGNVSIYKFSFKCSTLTVFKSSVEDQSHIFDSSNCQITKLQSFEPNTSLTFRVPDTITTWSVRAFSVNDKTGLGMLDDSLDIVTFQPFFLSVTLPYAVKRGEVLAIPVTVFNYLNDIFATEMKMFNNKNEFQFMNAENQPITTDVDTRELSVPANSGRSTTFTITPQRIGYIEIHIEAKNAITSDAVVHKLKVEPEGIAHNGNREQVITCTNGKTENINFKADIPSNIVPESEYLLLSISGDAMATTVENLDKLVQKPSGCGEQNMINLVPNILILDYLKILKKYNNKTDTIEHAKHFIDTGYQRELTYRHSNGAYSVFGPTSKSTENNWLTAYVTRFFIRAQKYSAIENRIIEDGLEYLTAQQLDDGSFPQRGFLFDPSHQNEYGFSAFVLLAFMEDAKYAKKYKSAIDKGMNYLRHNLPNVNDIYSLAIMANVFQKAGSSNDANLILEKLKPEGRINNGLKWWTKNNKNEESANDVEITSYILMALLESSPHEDYSSIYNWLLKQRNSKGGFGSTQDTVVGLQALIKYAEKASTSQNTNVKVQFVAKCGEDKNRKEGLITVDVSNALILQSEELPNSTRSVDVVVMGLGRVYVQFSYQYYTSQAMAGSPSSVVTETSNNRKSNAILKFSTRMGETTMPLPSPSSSSVPALPSLLGPSSTALQAPQASTIVWEYFHITPTAKITSTNDMSLEVCYTYQPFTEEEKLTNMVIMEIKFPSGYMANNDNLASLRDEEQISRIDSQNSATLIAIYFEKLEANDEQCLTAVADKIHDVTSLKASTIDMYDYYNDKRRTTVLYELKE
ncbi:thioester-containing protein 1 allele R1-like isoform X2 [Musca autumnalis]|uniref:thioester-containing protein 1 allele R1-like isoform X2 n=1 Tax=Musca autumnalis TaxID=221902 RepID=UPI003CF7376D